MSAKVRIKCPYCGDVSNLHEGETTCNKCRNQLGVNSGGSIYLYRQGSAYGCAGGFSIYINGEAYGSIGNKELLRIPLGYGTYNIHCAAGMSRSCRDLLVTVTPENPVAYTKVYIKPGFWTNSFVVEPMDPKLLEL
ncbi:MAG: hypothetical protein E7600_03620 [Ruminococcaceae bacterium]|nr:hypothetical protein [Oscillospiraceae bacterium]